MSLPLHACARASRLPSLISTPLPSSATPAHTATHAPIPVLKVPSCPLSSHQVSLQKALWGSCDPVGEEPGLVVCWVGGSVGRGARRLSSLTFFLANTPPPRLALVTEVLTTRISLSPHPFPESQAVSSCPSGPRYHGQPRLPSLVPAQRVGTGSPWPRGRGTGGLRWPPRVSGSSVWVGCSVWVVFLNRFL